MRSDERDGKAFSPRERDPPLPFPRERDPPLPFPRERDPPLCAVVEFNAFEEFRSSCGVQGGKIEYSLEFNRYGLLSLLMTCLSEDGKPLFYETANFNTDTGLRVSLTECFGAGADPGERLNELVAAYAEANDMTYISSGPNVTDSTQFLFTFGGLTLVFREYELFTPDAGTTRIKVRCAEVQDLLAADGLLNRLK